MKWESIELMKKSLDVLYLRKLINRKRKRENKFGLNIVKKL
jgi:hypothetical protein